jgi:hypothetical protein
MAATTNRRVQVALTEKLAFEFLVVEIDQRWA